MGGVTVSHLERDDIQGIILRGYEEMLAACFIVAHIEKPDNFKTWLKAAEFRSASIKPLRIRKDRCINIAFTRPGLECLGIDHDVFKRVSREFYEGMVGRPEHRLPVEKTLSPDQVNHRSRMLGDFGTSAPANWRWGDIDYLFKDDPEDFDVLSDEPDEPDEPVDQANQMHVLLLLYAPDQLQLRDLYESIHCDGNKVLQKQSYGLDYAFDAAGNGGECPGEATAKEADGDLECIGLRILRVLSTTRLDGRKEHFGYRDGIGQPVVEGEDVGNNVNSDNVIRAGEFLFGYRNEYGRYPIQPETDDNKDFGRNGSFLVFRQLAQDVPGYWGFVAHTSKSINRRRGDEGVPDSNKEKRSRLRLASQMVGRWPSGAPMVLAPDQDNPALEDENNFNFFDEDPDGHRCPFGSHVRRTNPRDAFPHSKTRATRHSRHHRIIRRGRAYGAPVPNFIRQKGYDIDPNLEWDQFTDEKDTYTESCGASRISRGLHFICFNANISRQFEFIQSTWIMNPKFAGLSFDPDPVTGEHGPREGDTSGELRFRAEWKGGSFTIQGEPANVRITGLSRYVHVHGGGYFFMPGISALRYIAKVTA